METHCCFQIFFICELLFLATCAFQEEGSRSGTKNNTGLSSLFIDTKTLTQVLFTLFSKMEDTFEEQSLIYFRFGLKRVIPAIPG